MFEIDPIIIIIFILAMIAVAIWGFAYNWDKRMNEIQELLLEIRDAVSSLESGKQKRRDDEELSELEDSIAAKRAAEGSKPAQLVMNIRAKRAGMPLPYPDLDADPPKN